MKKNGKLIVCAGPFVFAAKFEENAAPQTVAAFKTAMPFESQATAMCGGAAKRFGMPHRALKCFADIKAARPSVMKIYITSFRATAARKNYARFAATAERAFIMTAAAMF